MKRILTIITLMLSVSALAMPPSADVMITELMTNNNSFKELVRRCSSKSPGEPNFDSITVTATNLEDARAPCQQFMRDGAFSKSAGFVRVEFRIKPNTIRGAAYFHTSGAVEDLALCKLPQP